MNLLLKVFVRLCRVVKFQSSHGLNVAVSRPIASEALKALAVLTSHPGVREVLLTVPSPFAGVMALLCSTADPVDIHQSAVTILGNLSACRAHAKAITRLKGLPESAISFMAPTASPDLQSRCAADHYLPAC